MGRVLFHLGEAAFLFWIVFGGAVKWAFLAGLALFGFHAWDSRPGGDERARRAEQARQERPIAPEERVRDAVGGASTITLRLVERRWLRATVEARNPTHAPVELEGVRCRVLFDPDGGQRPDVHSRGPWRIRLEPGGTHRSDVRFHDPAPPPTAPTRLADHRCALDVRVVPPPAAPLGSPSNPIRMAPSGYRADAGR